MKFTKNIRKNLGLSRYAFARKVRDTGIEISDTAFVKYEDKACRMRLDVLCAYRYLSGKSWQELGDALDAEFFKKPVA